MPIEAPLRALSLPHFHKGGTCGPSLPSVMTAKVENVERAGGVQLQLDGNMTI